MRIGLVCPYSLSLPGGVQGQVTALSRAFGALGHRATVLAPVDATPPEPGVRAVGRSVRLLANGSVAPVAFGPRSVRRTSAALEEEQPDVLHLHEPLVPGPTLASLIAHSAPLVGTFHRAGPSRSYELLAPLVRRLAAGLDVRVAVSAEARDTAASALGGSYEMLWNAVEVDRLAKATPWPTVAPTVLFLGRHEPRKGLSVLLEAWGQLGVDARLWIAGSGPETAVLRRRHRDLVGVEWLGTVEEVEKASRLRGADVLCAPSLHGESFGVVLLEAMAARAAIVATDLDAYRRVARPDQDALLVPIGDARALAGALRKALTDRSAAAALVASGEERVLAYDIDRLAQRYLELSRSLL